KLFMSRLVVLGSELPLKLVNTLKQIQITEQDMLSELPLKLVNTLKQCEPIIYRDDSELPLKLVNTLKPQIWVLRAYIS
ncbi:hypothetical protein, partial [Methanomethylophilus alvi]|uniref:hypothetical protein n=1 Tax=Methanomethylophilus alvi TaxID=1291540 RepID=UPI0037DDD251